MNNSHTFGVLWEAVEAERLRLQDAPHERIAPELAKLALEEIRASARLAGATLQLSEVAALVERGVALGDRPLSEYLITADYADAAKFVERAANLGRKKTYLRMSEIVEAHARATRRAPTAHPGTWRTVNFPAFPGGMVPPPPWLVPREIGSYVDRIAVGPPAGEATLLWIADAHERFERIHPFTSGNGRAGRLIVNLLLRRCGYPPFAVRDRDVATYLAALRQADRRDPWPLGILIARNVLASLLRLSACEANDALADLSSFAHSGDRDALYKAAQRGRLRTVRRNGAVLTTQAWIDAYRASRFVRDLTESARR